MLTPASTVEQEKVPLESSSKIELAEKPKSQTSCHTEQEEKKATLPNEPPQHVANDHTNAEDDML